MGVVGAGGEDVAEVTQDSGVQLSLTCQYLDYNDESKFSSLCQHV